MCHFLFTGIVRSPSLDTPNRDAVRLWTALGPRLCRVAATRHQVCAYPCLDTLNRDAVRLWTALGPRLCRVAATRHQVCAYPCLDTPNRDAVRLWTALGPRLCRVAATRHHVCAVGIGRVPMQKLLLLAELKALPVCPCRIYYF